MTQIASSEAHLARRLGLFDTTMLVMGGIIGSGIFINPYVVAQQVPSTILILAAWTFGGLIALAGAFIYAELSSQTSASGGQYVYLRDAFHPALAFVYGWALLLVTQSGGMAAVAVTFAKYVCALGHAQASDNFAAFLAAIALAVLTVINCFGVRAGSTTQNLFMILKLLAIAALVAFGLSVSGPPATAVAKSTLLRHGYGGQASLPPGTWNSLMAFGAALIPVQFAYGGWQTSCFVAGEVREPQKNLPRGLMFGVLSVIAVYLSVNFVCVHALGPLGLAETKTPASAVMRLALGENGARIIAVGIAVSTIGFLSQSMLTAPRVYFAMAEDGLFFSSLAKLNRARVPAFAIALQGALAVVITLSGRYEQILNYVISVDVIFFALTAATVFVFRRRVRDASRIGTGLAFNRSEATFRVPGHPFTTLFFIAACCGVAFSTVYRYPHNSAIGLGIMLTGIPVYLFWRSRAKAVKA